MDEKPVTADVVVACLFAGVGAWAADVQVGPTYTYASELFGEGHATLRHPREMPVPMVTVTIPGNSDRTETPADESDADGTGPQGTGTSTAGTDHAGVTEIRFTLTAGEFAANVAGLMWDPNIDADGPDNDGDEDGDPTTADADDTTATTGNRGNDFVVAPGTVASIVDGGRSGDSHITIKIEAAETADSPFEIAADPGTGAAVRDPRAWQRLMFRMPTLKGLESLGGAGGNTPTKSVKLVAESRIISGAFSNGPLTGTVQPNVGRVVVSSRDAVTVAVSDDATKATAIDGDDAFMAVKGAKDGYVELATVTVTTKQIMTPAVARAAAKHMYDVHGDTATDAAGSDGVTATGAPEGARRASIFKPAVSPKDAQPWTLYDLDGEEADDGLRGTLTVNAMGTRGLFNDGDELFVDYDGNGKMGPSEQIATDGDMGEGSALSIDADDSESFKDGVGSFKIFYMAGGKDQINHGAMITLTANVDYSDPTARDEAPKKQTTTFNFDGVGNPVMAYAIPHSTNGMGDKGNVRVRCEGATDCRVFLECWGDMGMRGFGEVDGGVPGNGVMVWDGAAIEGVTGLEPSSRHSCRVLSKGMVTVQQLTRDGNSQTLVNNTYVGGGM